MKKNFEAFVSKKEQESNANDERDGDDEQNEEKKQEQHDFQIFKRCNLDHGRSYDNQFFTLLSQVFDEDMRKVEKFF